MPADTSTTTAAGLSSEDQSKIKTALARTNDTVTFTKPGGEPLTLSSIFGPEPQSRMGIPSSRGYFEEDKRSHLWYKLGLAKRPESTMSDVQIHWGKDTFVGDIHLTTRLEAQIKDDDRDKINGRNMTTTARWFSGQTESPERLAQRNGTLQQEGGPELKVAMFEEVHLELKNLRVPTPTVTQGDNAAPTEEDEGEGSPAYHSAPSSPMRSAAD